MKRFLAMLGIGSKSEIAALQKEAAAARVLREERQKLARLAQRELTDKLFRHVISPTQIRTDGQK